MNDVSEWLFWIKGDVTKQDTLLSSLNFEILFFFFRHFFTKYQMLQSKTKYVVFHRLPFLYICTYVLYVFFLSLSFSLSLFHICFMAATESVPRAAMLLILMILRLWTQDALNSTADGCDFAAVVCGMIEDKGKKNICFGTIISL